MKLVVSNEGFYFEFWWRHGGSSGGGMSTSDFDSSASAYALDDGSRVAVVGGGAAGSLFSIFLLTLADRVGLDLHVDLFEPKDFFTQKGPTGCNMCGGIISESLVQMLATEGINLPPTRFTSL